MVTARPRAVAAAVEPARDVDRGVGVERGLTADVAEILEASLVDDPGAENLCVADLQRLLSGYGIVRLGSQAEGTSDIVGFGIAVILVASSQGVVLAELVVEARADVGASLGIQNRAQIRRW